MLSVNDSPERPPLDDSLPSDDDWTRSRSLASPGDAHMRRPRIAIVGDTKLEHGELTNAGAIAIELASGWPVDVGFRSVASDGASWEALESHFGALGITTWLGNRKPGDAEADTAPSSTIQMGDQLNIEELFGHDLVIVASRDVALRRFLADLPVHTYPGVRMLSSIHFREGVITNERLEDLTRFDVIIGSELDFTAVAPEGDDPDSDNALAAMAPVIHGTNVRAAISWGKHGAFRCISRDAPLLTLPPHHAPHTSSDAPWAAFVGAVAFGMTKRQRWEEIGRDASRRFAIRAQALRSERA
jgi:hypothetical protein